MDAGSTAQHAITKGYLTHSSPGHFALTATGAELVKSLPED